MTHRGAKNPTPITTDPTSPTLRRGHSGKLRRMWRKLLRALGCLSYLTLLLALFAVVSYVAFSQFVRRGVTPTPELFGLAEEDARALLTDQGLAMEWSEANQRYDDRVPDGHILMQRPPAGALVKRGGDVTVVISKGPQLIEVPSVLGEAVQAAQVNLHAAGLRTGRTLAIYSRDGQSGTVVAQRPAGGQRVERDAQVDLFLALENVNETFVMPDLVYKPYDNVRRFFETRGFRLGRVSYQSYSGIDPGTVLRQFPLPGHQLRRGDVISLAVVTPLAPLAEGDPDAPPTSSATPSSQTEP